MIMGMKPPVLVRALNEHEHRHRVAGLRSSEAFVLRRCQVLLASAQGKSVKDIAAHLGCATQTVRNIIKAFNQHGQAALQRQSNRPKNARPVLDEPERQRLNGQGAGLLRPVRAGTDRLARANAAALCCRTPLERCHL